MTNSLMGILKTLGLNKRIKDVSDLQSIIKEYDEDVD
jgi:hypothetical protein